MANFIDRIAKSLGYAKRVDQSYPEVYREQAAVLQYEMPDGQTAQAQGDLYRVLSWVNAAVYHCASIAITATPRVQTRNGEELQDVKNHDFERLLMRPNPTQSRSEFLRATYASYKLTGNAYWYLNRPSGEKSAPVELWIIPPQYIKPAISDNETTVGGYIFSTGVREVALEKWEVAHFKTYNPNNPFIGLSSIESVALTSRSDIGMQAWNAKNFTERNGRLPGILAFSDVVAEPEWQKIKREVNENTKNQTLMLLRGIGSGQMQYIQSSISQKDMEFMSGRNFNKEEIWSVLAPGLSSMLAVNANEANARTGRATLIDLAIYPLLTEISEKVTADIMPSYGPNYIMTFDDIRITDRQMQLNEQQEYNKTHTIDEVRSKYYGDQPIGDERGTLLPAQVSPTTGQEQTESIQAQPDDIRSGSQSDDNMLMDANTLDELEAWEKFALRRIGKKSRPFECKFISASTRAMIENGLSSAETAEDIKNVFELARNGDNPVLGALVAQMKRANDLLESVNAARA